MKPAFTADIKPHRCSAAGPPPMRCRGQPGGLPEGSRWSFRARGERPPESRVRERAPRRGARTGPSSTRVSTAAGLAPLPGCSTSPAPLPGGRRPLNPRRPPATLWQAFGLTKASKAEKPLSLRSPFETPSNTLRSSFEASRGHHASIARTLGHAERLIHLPASLTLNLAPL